MLLKPKEIHIWSTDLAITPAQEQEKSTLLSPDEIKRAERFRFAIHRRRYIAARSSLRELISLYLNIPPQKIVLAYGDLGKPYVLEGESSCLQFNLAHSHELAVYAFTLNHAIGIDIEKVQDHYTQAVAERFFTHQENMDLLRLPPAERISGFYRIWARKEAIIKAIGKGLAIPLNSFSVSINDINETLMFNHELWSLVALSIHPDYQSALASNQIVETISYWCFFDKSYNLNKLEKL